MVFDQTLTRNPRDSIQMPLQTTNQNLYECSARQHLQLQNIFENSELQSPEIT